MTTELYTEKRSRKRREAEARNAHWRELSTRQKLDSLHARGHQNCKQFTRLVDQMVRERES